jgi:hypothetical protein
MAMHVEMFGPESGTPSRRLSGLRAADRAAVLMHVTSLMDALGAQLAPAELLTFVCEMASSHLSLLNVVFFKRVAGQSRVLAWSAPGASTASRLRARERVWSSVAAALDEAVPSLPAPEGDEEDTVVTVSIGNGRLGLSALLQVESLRRLDENDRVLIEEVLRRLLDATHAPRL